MKVKKAVSGGGSLPPIELDYVAHPHLLRTTKPRAPACTLVAASCRPCAWRRAAAPRYCACA